MLSVSSEDADLFSPAMNTDENELTVKIQENYSDETVYKVVTCWR